MSAMGGLILRYLAYDHVCHGRQMGGLILRYLAYDHVCHGRQMGIFSLSG